MNKHLNLDITDLSIEIIWLLTHLINSNNTELTKKIIESELYTNIFSYFFKEILDDEIIERILWFIFNLISATKNFENFCNKKINFGLKIIFWVKNIFCVKITF